MPIVVYQVQAANNQSLLAALNAASPIREDGEVFHGYTEWNITWRFVWRHGSNGAC
ncbi:MAG: DUF922 domain-containing Zn-dependent protease [Desulfobulbaceae bacterium]|nr:DUF922 domain-containing Zn-dependent protease [Desulfobulbaceae bacterium]